MESGGCRRRRSQSRRASRLVARLLALARRFARGVPDAARRPRPLRPGRPLFSISFTLTGAGIRKTILGRRSAEDLGVFSIQGSGQAFLSWTVKSPPFA